MGPAIHTSLIELMSDETSIVLQTGDFCLLCHIRRYNLGTVLVLLYIVPLCSEVFTEKTHTSIDPKFHSGSFAVWFVDGIFHYKTVRCSFHVYYACVSSLPGVLLVYTSHARAHTQSLLLLFLLTLLGFAPLFALTLALAFARGLTTARCLLWIDLPH